VTARSTLALEILRVSRSLGVPPQALSRERFRALSPDGFKRAARDWTAAKKEAALLAEREATVSPEVTIEARKLRDRVRLLEREKSALTAALEEATERQDFLDATQDRGPGIVRRERASGLREGTAVTLWSDWHVEEPVDPDKVGGLNEYSLPIADESIRGLVRGVCELVEKERHAFVINDLVIGLIGDLFSGHIHDDLVEACELSPIEAVIWLQQRISGAIRAILAETKIERVIVACQPGNHGRTTLKPRISTRAENSYEWLMYHTLSSMFADDPRIEFRITKSELLYVPIYDRVVRFTHGDAIKYAGGVGGVHIPLRKAIMGWDSARKADLTCLGHFHTHLTHPSYVTNGSLIGYGPFSQRIKADFEAPQQAFFVIDSKRGPTAHSAIWVR
jgi:hypothetical protein